MGELLFANSAPFILTGMKKIFLLWLLGSLLLWADSDFEHKTAETLDKLASVIEETSLKLTKVRGDYDEISEDASRLEEAESLQSQEAELAARLDEQKSQFDQLATGCLLYTSPSPRDQRGSRMPSSA